jgi:signal transduction histidine kinase
VSMSLNLQKKSGRLNTNRMAPYQVVGIGMMFAFIVMLILSLLEPTLLRGHAIEGLMLVHFLRGFIATTTGMFFMWWIMHRKETELVGLRDQFKQQLQTRTMQLEETVCESKQQIKEMESLQRALTEEREDFLLALQLRLKTPVRANGLTVHHLVSGEYGDVTAMQREVLSLMAENNTDIERLVSMLVSLYRFRNGTVNLNKTICTLEELLPQHQDLLEKASRRSVTIEHRFSRGLACECDADEIRRLLNHLLDNAIKYAKSTVLVSSTTNDRHLEIVVADDGAGVAPEDLERLFDRFHYVTCAGGYAPFTGIGLCLCAEIAKAHRGYLTCKSVPGQGAEFTLRIPCASSEIDS